jgi:hypothetical protein
MESRCETHDIEFYRGECVQCLIEERDLVKENELMARQCLDMVKDKIESAGINCDATPPMFYPEAMHNAWVKMNENIREDYTRMQDEAPVLKADNERMKKFVEGVVTPTELGHHSIEEIIDAARRVQDGQEPWDLE